MAQVFAYPLNRDPGQLAAAADACQPGHDFPEKIKPLHIFSVKLRGVVFAAVGMCLF
jgi:hypothetical protein